MSRFLKAGLLGGPVVIVASLVALAQTEAPPANAPNTYVLIDQGVDQDTLERYHHTDQGTRLLPAAWMAAIEKPDGSGKVMNPIDLARYGFIIDPVKKGSDNPTVGRSASPSAIRKSGGVAVAGITCAACHTGRVDYRASRSSSKAASR